MGKCYTEWKKYILLSFFNIEEYWQNERPCNYFDTLLKKIPIEGLSTTASRGHFEHIHDVCAYY